MQTAESRKKGDVIDPKLDALLGFGDARNKHEKFSELYQKYVAGKKWLEEREAKGIDVKNDREEYFDNVLYPIHCLWESLKPEDKAFLEKVMNAYEKLDGKKISFKGEKP